MEKPITIIRDELKTSFANLINANTNLPAFIIVDILESLLRELKTIEQSQLQNDKLIYEQSCEVNTQEVVDGDTE